MSFILPGMLGVARKAQLTNNNNYSLSFDGLDDVVVVPDASQLNFGNSTTDSPFSWSFWVKLRTGYSNSGIISKATGTGDIQYFMNILHTGANALKPFFRCYDNDSGNGIGYIFDQTLSTNTWTHMAFTYDGSGSNTGMKCYLNASEITSKTASNLGSYTAMHQDGAPINIGSLGYAGIFFDGFLDEVVCWDKELTSANVTEIYNSAALFDARTSSISSNIVGYWAMEAGSGNEIVDYSTYNNNGSMSASPATWSTDVKT
jgi:hypothetical protein